MRSLRVLLIVVIGVSPAAGQIPEKFENLQVLPRDASRGVLLETMRNFSFSLGVRCEFCHVGDGGPELANMIFSSDEKETKRTARRMLAMVRAINEEHIGKLERASTLTVGCATCHRGVSRPEPIESIVESSLTSSGIESAVARYRELRKEHYGSAAYEFGSTPLNRLGENLMRAGNAEGAVAVLELNAEFHPDSSWLQQLLGEAYLAKGDEAKARDALERSLALNPENPMVKKRLEELQKRR